jgi:predicted dehydrogenase
LSRHAADPHLDDGKDARMSVGFGLIGSGFMSHTYAQCLAKHVPDGHLVAVACGSRAAGLADEYSVELERDADALLAREDIEAVIIATPHSTHLPLTRAAAAAGKHVYIEKPMAVTLADCDAMIAACREAGVLLNVNNVTRHRASPGTAKRLLDEGRIGELRMIRVLSSVIGYIPDDHGWAHQPGEGGAWLDMGVHLFDATRWFTGSEVDLVFATIRDFGGDEHQRRTGMAELVMRNGVLVQVLISFEMPSPGLGSQSQWTLIGADGIIESDSYGKVRLGRGDGWEDVFEMPPFALNADVYSPVRLEAFAEQTQEFAVAVRSGASAPPPALQGGDGRAAVEIVEAAARSSARGEAVRLPIDAA